MPKQILSPLLMLCLILPHATFAQTPEPRPELRAFWADAFNPAFKSPQEADEMLQRLHAAHCNAIFAQVRKGGDAYYRSHYEPWAKDDTGHFDALAYLIEKAHSMKPPIAVHAWINTCAVGGNGKNPFNIVHLHPDWLSTDPKNQDFDGEATKIDPGNPDAADWTFRVYLDVARHYDVDGIHFDFVRYGGREWGYNPVSVARFQQRYVGRKGIKRLPDSNLPDPSDETWKQWRRDQVTDLVRKVYAHAVSIKPRLVISAAVITWADAPKTEAEWKTKTAAMNRTYQDWRGWLQEGITDLACPMTYFQADTHTDWQRNWSEYIKNHQYRRAATVAVGTWFNTIPQSLELIQIARSKSRRGRFPYGVMLYSYAGTNASETKDEKGKRKELEYQPDFYAALSEPVATPETGVSDPSERTKNSVSSGISPTAPNLPNLPQSRVLQNSAPFPSDVAIPSMPWKADPKTGHIKGFALTAQLDPVDGATIEVSGHGRIARRTTDGTGFYAFVDLPPGAYSVKESAPGFAPVRQKAVVTAGKVTTLSVTLGSASVPITSSLASLVSPPAPVGTPVRMENLTVLVGSDTFPGNLYGADTTGAAMRIRLANPPLLPFQPGDVISVTGTVQNVEGEPTIDSARARLTDIRPLSDLPSAEAVSGKDLKAGRLPNGLPVVLQAAVVESNPEGFAVDVGGIHIQVPLAGHKDFGVEAAGLNIPPPVVGTDVLAKGILIQAAGEKRQPVYRLHVTDSNAVHTIIEASLWRKIWAPAVALITFRNLGLCYHP